MLDGWFHSAICLTPKRGNKMSDLPKSVKGHRDSFGNCLLQAETPAA